MKHVFFYYKDEDKITSKILGQGPGYGFRMLQG